MVTFGAWRADRATPYPQSVVLEHPDRLYAVGCGGGGGAAQLLPASELAAILDGAVLAAPADVLAAVHAGVIERKRDSIWAGTHAELVIARWERPSSTLWVAGVGMCCALLLRGDRVEVIQRETTLGALQPGAPADLHQILVRALGGDEPPSPPHPVDIIAGDRVVLASNPGLDSDALASFVRTERQPAEPRAHAQALWTALRGRGSVGDRETGWPFEAQFDRRAAIGVLQL